MRHEDIFLGVDKVVGTCCEVSLSLFQHILLNLFGDVDIIVLPPFSRLEVICVAVVMSAVCSAFMDQ